MSGGPAWIVRNSTRAPAIRESRLVDTAAPFARLFGPARCATMSPDHAFVTKRGVSAEMFVKHRRQAPLALKAHDRHDPRHEPRDAHPDRRRRCGHPPPD